MPSPFPGMDPYLEKSPLFHELHTQMLAAAQARLQPQLRPKYVAKLERYLSEGSVWSLDVETLEGKEPDLTIVGMDDARGAVAAATVPARPSATAVQELEPEEIELRKQRRIVIYVQSRPRQAVASIELLSPSNKQAESLSQRRYLEKRSSALHGGLHWIEIDLLRGGRRPPVPVDVPTGTDYLAYVAQATSLGWKHLIYAWQLADPLPNIPIPLMGSDNVVLPLRECFDEAYDRIAADEEAEYRLSPPGPGLSSERMNWIDNLLREQRLRR